MAPREAALKTCGRNLGKNEGEALYIAPPPPFFPEFLPSIHPRREKTGD